MKRRVLMVLLVLVVALSAQGCVEVIGGARTIRGSGNVVTREEDITGFDEVDVSHAFTVDISRGDTFSVVIHVDDNLVEYLEVVKEGNTLKIGLKAGTSVTNATLQGEVTMPELAGLELSGASHVTITGLTSAKRVVVVDASGASHLAGDIKAGDASFNVSGASHVTLTGSARDVTIDASGASYVDLAGFPMANADVKASGASHVTVKPSGRLDVNASGASHVSYVGSPTLGNVETSGASSIKRK